MQQYLQWINQRLGDETGYGSCKEISEEMQASFPELSLRHGLFHSLSWGPRTHWWLRTPSGEIVDPTGRQHPDGTLVATSKVLLSKYEDFTDLTHDEFRRRLIPRYCLECGNGFPEEEGVYEGRFCSIRCARACVGV